MRKTILFIVSLTIQSLFSQCIVDAGPKQHICFPENLGFHIGSLSATITTGTAPYQIEWKATYQLGGVTKNASDFLDDIHSLTPTLINYVSDSIVFYIEVTDDNGATCSDSVVLSFTLHIVTLDDCIKFLTKGDSVELFVPGIAGIPNMQYTWSPNYHISNVNDENPLVWPDSNTHYSLIGIDEHGCQFNSPGCFVTVYGVGLDENNKELLDIFPNPANDVLQIKIENTEKVLYTIVDVTGKIAKNNIFNGNNTIDIADLPSGVYVIHLKTQDLLIGSAKFIKH